MSVNQALVGTWYSDDKWNWVSVKFDEKFQALIYRDYLEEKAEGETLIAIWNPTEDTYFIEHKEDLGTFDQFWLEHTYPGQEVRSYISQLVEERKISYLK